MMLLEIVLSLAAIVVARTLWMRWKYDLHKMPSPPGRPLIGHTLDIMGGRGKAEMNRFLGTRWRALGEPRVFRVELGGRTLLCVRDVDCAKNVIMSKTAPFSKSHSAEAMMTTMIGNDPTAKALLCLLNVTPYTKAVRKMYATMQQSSHLQPAVAKLHTVLDGMIEVIEMKRKGGAVDLQELCLRMALDAVGAVALDANLGGLDGSRSIYQLLLATGHVMRVRVHTPLQALLLRLLPFLNAAREQERTLDAMCAEWDALTKDILERDDPPTGEEPLWHALRTMKDPDTGKKLEYKSLLAEVASTVLGGMDTTGHQLSFIFALLASSPHVVDKIIDELTQHGLCGPDCRDIALEDLSQLTYLTATVKEGMRIGHIAVAMMERVVPRDMTILGYRVPKGTVVLLPGNRWLNSESEWGDPHVFRPERFLTAEDLSQKYYLPFGYGPRDCAGQKLAMLEMRIAIARLIQKYRFTLSGSVEQLYEEGCDGFVIESANGIWLHVTPREAQSCQQSCDHPSV